MSTTSTTAPPQTQAQTQTQTQTQRATMSAPHSSWHARARGGGFARPLEGFERTLLKSSEVTRELDPALLLTVELTGAAAAALDRTHLEHAWLDTLYRMPLLGVEIHVRRYSAPAMAPHTPAPADGAPSNE